MNSFIPIHGGRESGALWLSQKFSKLPSAAMFFILFAYFCPNFCTAVYNELLQLAVSYSFFCCYEGSFNEFINYNLPVIFGPQPRSPGWKFSSGGWILIWLSSNSSSLSGVFTSSISPPDFWFEKEEKVLDICLGAGTFGSKASCQKTPEFSTWLPMLVSMKRGKLSRVTPVEIAKPGGAEDRWFWKKMGGNVEKWKLWIIK